MVWTYISYAIGGILMISGALILANLVHVALPNEVRIIFGLVITFYGIYRIVSIQKRSIDKKRWEE